jgi:predicted TIM-barrel fold metal-dependent hydrolase
MKIDAYSHFFPEKYLAALRKKSQLKNVYALERGTNTDINQRIRWLDKFPELLQILTIPTPGVESLVSPVDAVEIAKIANEELAEIVLKYPDKFYASVACLPLNDVDASLNEIDRAVKDLKMIGIQIPSDINGDGLDLPKYRPIFAKMAAYDLPIWIHPGFPKVLPVPLGLLDYETYLAMMQIVSSGIFLDFPNLKIITHHCGGIVPIIEGRIRWFFRGVTYSNGRPINVIDHLRKFYGDTAVS